MYHNIIWIRARIFKTATRSHSNRQIWCKYIRLETGSSFEYPGCYPYYVIVTLLKLFIFVYWNPSSIIPDLQVGTNRLQLTEYCDMFWKILFNIFFCVISLERISNMSYCKQFIDSDCDFLFCKFSVNYQWKLLQNELKILIE